MWPNSSLSKRLSVTAPISTLTISCLWRGESACISRASISFPVPFSPVIRILASVTATFSTSRRSRCMAGLSPQYMACGVIEALLLPVALPGMAEVFLWLADAAFSNVSTNFWLSHGFTMKSVAPSLMPRTARSISAYAVKSTTGRAGCSFLISCSQYSPSFPVLMPEVKFMSRRTTCQSFSRNTLGKVTGEKRVVICSK